MISYLRRVITGLFSLLVTIVGVIPFILETPTFSTFLSTFKIDRRFFVSRCLLIFGIIIFLAILLYYLDNRTKETAGKHFAEFHRELLSQVFMLRSKNTSAKDYSSLDDFYLQMQQPCRDLCAKIALFLKAKFGKDFSVCIKMIDAESLIVAKKCKNFGMAKVFTLCRAGHKQEERESIDINKSASGQNSRFLIAIEDNSDFLTIMEADGNTKASVFACPNLITHAILCDILHWRFPLISEYKNSTDKYYKKYLSTVVVPIRIESKYLQTKQKKQATKCYQVVGFLCIDYRWPLPRAVTNEIVGYIKGFGDAFYELFHEISVIDRKLLQSETTIATKGG